MDRKYFNFNNEAGMLTLDVDPDTGRAVVLGDSGVMAEYDSVQQLAEMYAQARDVQVDNLKHWTLLENGDVYSFVLRAGTAGVAATEISDLLTQVFDELRQGGTVHPLDIRRVKNELNGALDVENTLAGSAVPGLARTVYDKLDEWGAFVVEEPEQEPEDTRSDMEKYLVVIAERDHSLAFFAQLVNADVPALDSETGIAELASALETGIIQYTKDMVQNLYETAINNALTGINVDGRWDAVLLASGEAPNLSAERVVEKLAAAARLAGRDSINMAKYVFGRRHIRKSMLMVPICELQGYNLSLKENEPVWVEFSKTVDEELEAERDAAEQEAEVQDATRRVRQALDDVEPEDDTDEDDTDEDGYEW